MVSNTRSTPPTAFLPPLNRLPSYSFAQITQAIANLRALYCVSALYSLPSPKAPKHLVHDTSVPDSGYASAEGEEDSDDEEEEEYAASQPDHVSDAYEREYTIRWLTGFAARSDMWVCAPDCSDDEADARAALVDDAASLLASFARADEEETAITRTFAFPTRDGEVVHVQLNDAPLINDDHTSVGLQSWGSSIRLAERICMNPSSFGIVGSEQPLRVLELGAGTGLLSITVSQLLAWPQFPSQSIVVATDYHSSVLENLGTNVASNPPSSVDVLRLDWEHPEYVGSLVDPFDVILAADVIYHPEHARWIKSCVERLLARPRTPHPGGNRSLGGVFWLIVPLRPDGGRHERMSESVEAVFPHVSDSEGDTGQGRELGILSIEVLRKQVGVGRADEGGYKLYKVGWI